MQIQPFSGIQNVNYSAWRRYCICAMPSAVLVYTCIHGNLLINTWNFLLFTKSRLIEEPFGLHTYLFAEHYNQCRSSRSAENKLGGLPFLEPVVVSVIMLEFGQNVADNSSTLREKPRCFLFLFLPPPTKTTRWDAQLNINPRDDTLCVRNSLSAKHLTDSLSMCQESNPDCTAHR